MRCGKPAIMMIPSPFNGACPKDPMFAWLKTRSDLSQRATRLHDAIVAEARAPHLYAALRVPDTTDGRLEMLALHIVLVMDRLSRAGEPGQALSQALVETYVIAMDDTMRAIGIGDMAVPRKVKKAAAALYDRRQDYDTALRATLDAGDRWHDTLAATLAPLDGAPAIDLRALAHYADARIQSLAALPDAALLAGQLTP
jgi:cytochrome b pre-mRNA-processing protein 3